jgi:short-subunit dehydrogenase
MKIIPKTILITGASSGIGAALAQGYARQGQTLYLSGRDGERLEQVGELCRAKGAIVECRTLCVGNQGAMRDWILACDAKTPLDLVIANAGISAGTGGGQKGEPPEQAEEIFKINLGGVLNTLHPIIPKMVERGHGQIAVMASLAALRGFPGAPAYSASKGAVRFYGEALRGSLAPKGVCVSVICPGFVESRITAQNDFPMPFLMPAEKAAQKIIRGLERNTGRIAFPAIMYCLAGFLSVLPDCLAQHLLKALPEKKAASN